MYANRWRYRPKHELVAEAKERVAKHVATLLSDNPGEPVYVTQSRLKIWEARLRHLTTRGGIMDLQQALAIVRSLANGVDPESGEVFPENSAYQRPQVVRALYEAAAALEKFDRYERKRANMPVNTGKVWTEDEDRKLLAAFDAGRSLQELAAAHERTMGSVRARLLKYGRINA